MTLFAAQETDDGQALLHELIGILAQTNRRTKDAFIVAMAEWAVVAHTTRHQVPVQGFERAWEKSDPPMITIWDTVDVTDIDLVAQMTAFCVRKESTISCIRSLMVEKERGDTDWFGARYAEHIQAAGDV
jgi:hypothetical protein